MNFLFSEMSVFPNDIEQYISEMGTVENRVMEKNNQCRFVIAQRVFKDNVLTGSFIELIPNVKTTLTGDILKKENIDVSEIYESNDNSVGSLKSVNFFALSGKTLILTDSSSNNFISYINWLLEKKNSPQKLRSQISFECVNSVALGEIDCVVLKKGNDKNERFSPIAKFFTDIPRVNEISNDICKSVTIKLDRNQKEKHRVMDVLIQTTAEDITFITTDKRQIASGQLRIFSKFDIETNAKGSYCWDDVDKKIRQYIQR